MVWVYDEMGAGSGAAQVEMGIPEDLLGYAASRQQMASRRGDSELEIQPNLVIEVRLAVHPETRQLDFTDPLELCG